MNNILTTTLLTSVALLSSSTLFAGHHENMRLNEAIAGEHRTESSARDKYRHPLEALNFFQVQANHTVVEIWPGGGAWYTEVLAPYLRKDGKFFAAQYNPASDSEYQQKTLKKFNAKLAANPEVYNKVNMAIFNPPSEFKLGEAGTVDRVLTFRNVHNWTRSGDDAVLGIFQAFYEVLKTGGKLGVVEHRLPEDRKDGTAGYVKESYVIKMAETAGFKFEGSSEVNANAKDTADHKKGVWTLPPTLTLKEQDREKYLAIGESDRMTLLFVKK
ncbi:MAG: class I SAM-dependent methyltransferase [Gammaproteobacteria bacterium]|nr:class I SAM-dependent methyltransferase [Gammaproteobacteria bacterium]